MISAGKLDKPAIIRSHGGRPRAVEAGEVHIDIAFLAAASSDCCGNASGKGGKNNFGSMGFGIHDSHYADHTVIVTDNGQQIFGSIQILIVSQSLSIII